ncbi:DUF547 domain-containing protein [Kiloniella laminariae]|uniref:DUF547 domain-containing protein n=1 Tax=Kiloniella laminariae TaxID=454162 RepID=A0ABT4LMV2_9PROT|nr:DUF547 domain-containing protein [Kiloniella laminariae]MCZ4282404.1 DUF547 domain-containing protein [Kiloniella laminariae]
MTRLFRRASIILVVAAGFLVAGISSFEALLAPSAELLPHWTEANSENDETIPHQSWTRFLEKYRESHYDGIARLAYHRVTEDDQQKLARYINKLQTMPVSTLNRNEQFAFWVNLYNAVTVQLILQHQPVESIKEINISPGLFASGPWEKKLLRIEGEKLSLNDIAHGILRPIWKDPRVHYVLNCASLGCPDIPARALESSSDLDLQLDQAARKFVDHPRAVSISKDNDAVISSIYVWFKEDFGNSDAAILEHLRSHASKEKRDQLMQVRDLTDHRYDWNLNSVPVVTTASSGS